MSSQNQNHVQQPQQQQQQQQQPNAGLLQPQPQAQPSSSSSSITNPFLSMGAVAAGTTTQTQQQQAAAPTTNRIFSMEELQALRQFAATNYAAQQQQATVQQVVPQQQQQPQVQQPVAAPATNTTTNNNNNTGAAPAAPFVVLTQVPVQATPFASFANKNQPQQPLQQTLAYPQTMSLSVLQQQAQQQQAQAQQQVQAQQQQQPKNNVFDQQKTIQTWAQLLQPTPLAPNHQQPPPVAAPVAAAPVAQQTQQQPQMLTPAMLQQMFLQQQLNQTQQQQAQQIQMTPSLQKLQQQASSEAAAKNAAAAAAVAAAATAAPGAAPAATQDATTALLQQLMRNAAAAQQRSQQQQAVQQQQPQQDPSNQQQQQPQAAGTSLLTLGTPVAPVSVSRSNGMASQPFQDVSSWKQVWDATAKNMQQQQQQQSSANANASNSATNNNTNNSNQSNSSFPMQPSKRKFSDNDNNAPSAAPTTDTHMALSSSNPAVPVTSDSTMQMDQGGGAVLSTTTTSPPLSLIGMSTSPNPSSVDMQDTNEAGQGDDDDGSTNSDLFLDIVPTPLSEIKAKHLKHMLEDAAGNSSGASDDMNICAPPQQQALHHQVQAPQAAPAPAPAALPPALQLLPTAPISMPPVAEAPRDPESLSKQLRQFQLQNQQKAQQEKLQQHAQQTQQQQKAAHGQSQPQQKQLSHSQSARPPVADLAPRPPAAQAFLLPSTMMPPSVLASVCSPGAAKIGSGGITMPTNSTSASAASGGNAPIMPRMAPSGGDSQAAGRKKKTGSKSTRVESPQDVLARILQDRGYGRSIRVPAEQASYDTTPSPLQLASFGTELVKAIHTSDVPRLAALLACGLSPNPCNQFRDSIVDLVCKRANDQIFQCLVDHGCDLRVCDGFGRTPLHHCCWASDFNKEIAETILHRDWQQLFIEDKRGQTPLEYVRPAQAAEWVDFLEDYKDVFFPIGGSIPVVRSLREVRPEGTLPDPPRCLPVPLAAAVSSGQVKPEEVARMDDKARASYR